MMVPRPTMEKDLKSEEKELTEDIKNLEKKVSVISDYDPCLWKWMLDWQSKYLEKQFNDAQAQLRDIVCSFEIWLKILVSITPTLQFQHVPKG